MIFADKLIRLRKKEGWSQEELAVQMNISRQSVSKWESAQSIFNLDKNIHFSQLFGISTNYLLKGKSENLEEIAQSIQANKYFISILYCIIGILFVGIGVSLEVNARLVPLAGEGLVLAVCQAFQRPFPQTKIGFDCTLVILAVLLSLSTLHNIEGVREGTAAAAIFVGLTSKQVTRILFSSKHH